jgi:hypothetical protein
MLQFREYPGQMAADPEPIAVDGGEMPVGHAHMAIATQQMMDTTTYVMGGVKCGKLYKVFMKSLKLRDYLLPLSQDSDPLISPNYNPQAIIDCLPLSSSMFI